MKKLLGVVLLSGFIATTGCVSINSSAISESKGTAGQTVHVTVSGDPGILHLTEPKDLTVQTNKALLAQCSSGRLTNIQTQLSTRDFLGIVQIYKVRATAACQ
jgi:hypothetical protein